MQTIGIGRIAYGEEMRILEHDLLEMGSRAGRMVGMAVDSLTHLDVSLAMTVLAEDDEIDRRDLEIETRCLRLLALQQPMGKDLREIGTAMKVITDIERIGDLAVDIAKIGMKIEKEFGDATVIDIPRMASVARAMVTEALEAYIRRDSDLVNRVCERDEEVDEMYRVMREQLFRNMRTAPENVVTDGWLLLAIHHVERIADHAVNIAERVNFMVTGETKQPYLAAPMLAATPLS
jgi:phosphate transport system protein